MLMRKLQGNKTKPCDLSFFKITNLFLDSAFVALPGVEDRSEFTLDYSLQLTIAIYLYASTEKQALAKCGLPTCMACQLGEACPCNCTLYLSDSY